MSQFKKYVVVGIFAAINSGQIRIDGAQARRRLYALTPLKVDKETGAGIYEVVKPVQFKKDEQFEYNGDVPKAMANILVDPETAAALKSQEPAKPEKKKGVVSKPTGG